MNLLFNVFNHFLFGLLTNHILSEALAFFPVAQIWHHGWSALKFFVGGTSSVFGHFLGIFWEGIFLLFLLFLLLCSGVSSWAFFSFPLLCAGAWKRGRSALSFFVLGILKAWLVTVVISLAGAGGFTQFNLVWGGCLADCGNENDGGCE